jgi:L-threonylcarbamoyladenylate synthase
LTIYTPDPAEAAALLRAGGLVAFPTETVYGLGANARDPEALARIYEAKGRPADNPLIVHLAAPEAVLDVAARLPPDAEALAAAFWPGPLTLVLDRRPDLPAAVSAGLATVGVRVPALPLARAFLEACGTPVAAPSANRSGRPSPTTWEAVRDDLDGRIAAVLVGPPAAAGLESTVVDATGPTPVLLRPGAVSFEALRAVVPGVCLPEGDADLLRRSPGTRHRHYAPRARIVVVEGASAAMTAGPFAWIGLDAAPPGAVRALAAPDVAAYAHHLFAFFRACDAEAIPVIFCQRVPEKGLGRALNDRLVRAAEG